MRTLTTKMSLFELLIQRVYTQKWLAAHPLTQHLADDFAKLHERWMAVLSKFIELTEADAAAEALVAVADEDLDALHVAIINTLLTLVKNKRDHELFVSYTKNQTPSDQRKPTLGDQLSEMGAWVGSLQTSPHAVLNEHGVALAPKIKQGTDAETLERNSDQAIVDFSTTGELKQFVDEFNALRNATHGKVEEIRIRNNLPADFTERCFMKERRVRKPTRQSLLATIERLEAELKRHNDALEHLDAQEKAAATAREEANTAALQDELADLDAQERDLAKRRAEIQAKVGKPPSGDK